MLWDWCCRLLDHKREGILIYIPELAAVLKKSLLGPKTREANGAFYTKVMFDKAPFADAVRARLSVVCSTHTAHPECSRSIGQLGSTVSLIGGYLRRGCRRGVCWRAVGAVALWFWGGFGLFGFETVGWSAGLSEGLQEAAAGHVPIDIATR